MTDSTATLARAATTMDSMRRNTIDIIITRSGRSPRPPCAKAQGIVGLRVLHSRPFFWLAAVSRARRFAHG